MHPTSFFRLLAAALILGAPISAHADTSATLATAINLPRGPASIEGFGAGYEVSPASGLPGMSFALEVPPGRGRDFAGYLVGYLAFLSGWSGLLGRVCRVCWVRQRREFGGHGDVPTFQAAGRTCPTTLPCGAATSVPESATSSARRWKRGAGSARRHAAA